MATSPQKPQLQGPFRGAASLPGARTSCALLTLLTILLAWPAPPPALPILVRPAYFALLFWFFRITGRRSDQLRGQAMRLVCFGFLVLWVSATTSAVIHFASLENRHPVFEYLRLACDQGALFLLGTTLISYGLMLWIPQVLDSHRRLGVFVEHQSGELRIAESTRSELERGLVEADRRAILGELAASIAHDLRNPLSIVKGSAESLCRKPRSQQEIAEHTDVIRRNIEKADRTIASLIDLGRPRASSPVTMLASDIFAEVLQLVQIEANSRRLRFQITIAGNARTVQLHVDRTLLAQALLNLVLNAMQASPANSTITLRARTLPGGTPSGGTPSGGGTTMLAIEDRGTGLKTSVREHLFTPFYTTKQHGTGLGLLSCRRIATELGGHLGLYPRRRGGARAVLLLPATAPTPRATDLSDLPNEPSWQTSNC